MARLHALGLSSVPHRCRGHCGCRRRGGCGPGGGRAAPPGENGRGGAELRAGRWRGVRSPGDFPGCEQPWARVAGSGAGGAGRGTGRLRVPPPPATASAPRAPGAALALSAGELPAAAARFLLITSRSFAPRLLPVARGAPPPGPAPCLSSPRLPAAPPRVAMAAK